MTSKKSWEQGLSGSEGFSCDFISNMVRVCPDSQWWMNGAMCQDADVIEIKCSVTSSEVCICIVVSRTFHHTCWWTQLLLHYLVHVWRVVSFIFCSRSVYLRNAWPSWRTRVYPRWIVLSQSVYVNRGKSFHQLPGSGGQCGLVRAEQASKHLLEREGEDKRSWNCASAKWSGPHEDAWLLDR